MLYSDKNIVISDSIDSDKKELLEFMNSKGINERYYTEYTNGEPFINIKATVFRYSELEELVYVSTQELLAIVGRKNEKKEEQGYTRTKLLLIQGN